MLFVKMYRNKGNKNEEKLIILNVLMVFQNNQLMDDLINPFLDTLKAMALVGIPFTAAFCIYGIGDDYYWEHIASIEAAIKQKEESLKHPNLQTEYW